MRVAGVVGVAGVTTDAIEHWCCDCPKLEQLSRPLSHNLTLLSCCQRGKAT